MQPYTKGTLYAIGADAGAPGCLACARAADLGGGGRARARLFLRTEPFARARPARMPAELPMTQTEEMYCE